MSILVRGHQLIIRKNDIAPNQFRTISFFKSLYAFRFAMGFQCGRVFKNEKVHKAGGIVLLLPGKIVPCPRLVGLNVGNTLLNRLFDLLDAGSADLVFGNWCKSP